MEQGFDLLDKLLLLVTAGFIAPLTVWLKHKEWMVSGFVRPEFVKTILGIGAAFLFVWLLKMEAIGAEETIERGLQAIGGATAVYGGLRLGVKKKTGK